MNKWWMAILVIQALCIGWPAPSRGEPAAKPSAFVLISRWCPSTGGERRNPTLFFTANLHPVAARRRSREPLRADRRIDAHQAR
jgi:hypothetical protein